MRSFCSVVMALAITGGMALLATDSPAQKCDPVQLCGDVDASGKVGTTDALKVLKTAVGQQQSLVCTCSAGDGSCEVDLQTCNSDLTQCGDDLAACVGTPQEEIYEPIDVCGTDEPGFQFTLDGATYVVVETDVRMLGTNRVYALRLPIPLSVSNGYTSATVYHYVLSPTCDDSLPDCPLSSTLLTVCGKNGVALRSGGVGGFHSENVHNTNPNYTLSRYFPPQSRAGWSSAMIVVEEGFGALSLPGPRGYEGSIYVATPSLAERGWSIVGQGGGQLPVSYDTMREYLSHVSIREL